MGFRCANRILIFLRSHRDCSKFLGVNERSGDVAGMLMDIARDLTRWFFRAALRFKRAYIAVKLAGAIQKRLALMHGATCPKLLPARAWWTSSVGSYRKSPREKVPSSRFDLSFTGI
jgi:hypothetical protein